MIYANLEDDILPSKRHHNINILLVMQNCDNPEIYITFISTEGALRLLITIPSNPNPSILVLQQGTPEAHFVLDV